MRTFYNENPCQRQGYITNYYNPNDKGFLNSLALQTWKTNISCNFLDPVVAKVLHIVGVWCQKISLISVIITFEKVSTDYQSDSWNGSISAVAKRASGNLAAKSWTTKDFHYVKCNDVNIKGKQNNNPISCLALRLWSKIGISAIQKWEKLFFLIIIY